MSSRTGWKSNRSRIWGGKLSTEYLQIRMHLIGCNGRTLVWSRCSSRRRDWDVSRSRRRRRSLAVGAAAILHCTRIIGHPFGMCNVHACIKNTWKCIFAITAPQPCDCQDRRSTAVRLHVFLVLVNSIEQELWIHWENRSHRNFNFKRPYLKNGAKFWKIELFFDFESR